MHIFTGGQNFNVHYKVFCNIEWKIFYAYDAMSLFSDKWCVIRVGVKLHCRVFMIFGNSPSPPPPGHVFWSYIPGIFALLAELIDETNYCLKAILLK